MKLSQKQLKKYIYDNKVVVGNVYNFRKMINKEIKQTILGNINQYTQNCNSDIVMERIYWIVNDLDNYPKKCKTCNEPKITFGEWKKAYIADYCSIKCMANSKQVREKTSKTNLKRYGHINAGASKIIQKKIQKNNLKKYGVKSTLQHKETQDKIKQTLLINYGVDHNFKSSKIRKQIEQTNLKKYGVKNVFELDKFQQKAKDTVRERYGVDNIFQLEEIKKQNRQINLQKLGVEYPAQSLNVRKKMQATNMKRYGVKFASQNYDIMKRVIQRWHTEFYEKLDERVKNKVKPLFSSNEYCGIDKEYMWECVECGHQFLKHLKNGEIPRCLECYPLLESVGEREVKDFLKRLNINIIKNDKNIIKPYELDIVIPKKKIAIEYCGLYWHSEIHRPNNKYHQMKLQICNNAGYRLITIFEDEWINKRKICESRLRHIFGLNKTVCYARQTRIKEILSKEYKDFLINNHIQGYIGAKIKLGAFYNDELVSVMSFGKRRRALGKIEQKEDFYELLRFCTLGNIPGIGSKLFKYFTRNYSPKEIISYCDLRWGTGDFYKKLGFEYSHITKPNYWYSSDGIIRRHRYNYRKSALKEFKNYSDNKTEFQIMDESGYYRIWDCGNNVYIWKFN